LATQTKIVGLEIKIMIKNAIQEKSLFKFVQLKLGKSFLQTVQWWWLDFWSVSSNGPTAFFSSFNYTFMHLAWVMSLMVPLPGAS
jgi:hypothetical protein